MPFKKAIVSIILLNAFQKRQLVYYFAECLLKNHFILLYCWILFKKEIEFFTLLNAFQKDNCVLWSNAFRNIFSSFEVYKRHLFLLAIDLLFMRHLFLSVCLIRHKVLYCWIHFQIHLLPSVPFKLAIVSISTNIDCKNLVHLDLSVQWTLFTLMTYLLGLGLDRGWSLVPAP